MKRIRKPVPLERKLNSANITLEGMIEFHEKFGEIMEDAFGKPIMVNGEPRSIAELRQSKQAGEQG